MRLVTAAAVAGLVLVGCGTTDGPGGVLGEGPSGRPGTAVAGPRPPAPRDNLADPAVDPGEVAARVVAVETAIRDPATPVAAVADLGRTQQRLYADLVRHPERQPEVRAAVPKALRPIVEANLLAGTEIAALNPPPKPQPPHWRIVPPAPAGELLAAYRRAQAALGVPWEYLAAIHLVETRMGRIRGESSAGALGPMQFLPSTWRIYGGGGDINADGDAILAAARLLRSKGAPTDLAGALYAYNPSQHYVRAVTAYARQMAASDRAYVAYHAWQVYYGDRLLPEGFVG